MLAECDSLTLAPGYPLDTNPPQEEHGRMMIYMKEGHLTILLTHDKEHLSVNREVTEL